VPAAPAGFKSTSALYVTDRVVPSLKFLENQPTTFEALHSGPSTTTFFSPADIVATGHVPNALSISNIRKKINKNVSSKYRPTVASKHVIQEPYQPHLDWSVLKT
jgi:hypothetical protein